MTITTKFEKGDNGYIIKDNSIIKIIIDSLEIADINEHNWSEYKIWYTCRMPSQYILSVLEKDIYTSVQEALNSIPVVS